MGTIISEKNVTRRTFVKGASLGALAAAAAGTSTAALYGCAPESESATKSEPVEEEVHWGTCTAGGCSASYCPLKFHTVEGAIVRVEPDSTGGTSFGEEQARACLRGRSIRRWINHPDRLAHPMKRAGKRGEGKFEEITWDEAIELLAEKLRYTIDTYGNEAVFSAYSSVRNDSPFERLTHCLGGRLNMYGTDSLGQLMMAMANMYGYTGLFGSPLLEAENSDLVLMFGNSPAETRMSGGSGTYDLARVREAGVKIVQIDYRLNESCSAHPEEWLPIRSGTDGALASAMAYVLITEGFVDEEFVNAYCVGYDEYTMPEGSPEHASYKDYILGTGYDMVAKSPAWAAPITQIPAETITELARELGNAKAAFINQGWGIQRHSNGENACRTIPMLAILTGNIGKPGTSNGMREPLFTGPLAAFTMIPGGQNPVKTAISCISLVDAIDHGETMTALHDGVQGKDKLDVGIKFLMCDSTNIFNQRGDVGHTHDVLVDESKCEFIVVYDVFMTHTATYADLLLPGTTKHERASLTATVSAGAYEGALFTKQIVAPQNECRDLYDVCSDVSDKLGVKDAYTEGRTWEEWQRFQWDAAREKRPDLPTYDEGLEMGVWRHEVDYPPAFADFVADPAASPLLTPSGKIEIYSSTIAQIAQTWELDYSEDVISPIPVYDPGYESYEALTDEFPLYLSGWHPKSRAHSTFANVEVIAQAVRHQLWINPVDAKARGVENGDRVLVTSPRGSLEVEARVTPRIMPGIVGMPEGAWTDANLSGDRVDKGGNINMLCKNHLSPLAKHNPSNSNIVQVKKLSA